MTCRICRTEDTEVVLDLGNQVITSRFPVCGDFSTPTTPICLIQCKTCGLVQLKDLVSGSEMYEHMYGYRSGLNESMRAHLRAYNTEACGKVTLADGDEVLDIGSNDATFLGCYPNTLRRVGCDPTGSQFASYYTDMELVPTYFTKGAVTGTFKLVSSISMFYDLPDPVQFARDIHDVLSDDGIWTFEQSYLLTMLERNSVDTICHEHVEYYSVDVIRTILGKANMKIVDISTNECNGGSIRIYASKTGEEATSLVEQYIEKERGLRDPSTFRAFQQRFDTEIAKLKAFLTENPDTMIYGASTKGNCLLQYAGIGPDLVRCAVERNPDKVGRMTSTGIPIISEETMRANPPKNLLVLPWHFREGILARESEFIKNGGAMIFPLPTFDVVRRI
jgi:NDP-4-keto-2,6-dideoxyhexose 3-C-methyltransferase